MAYNLKAVPLSMREISRVTDIVKDFLSAALFNKDALSTPYRVMNVMAVSDCLDLLVSAYGVEILLKFDYVTIESDPQPVIGGRYRAFIKDINGQYNCLPDYRIIIGIDANVYFPNEQALDYFELPDDKTAHMNQIWQRLFALVQSTFEMEKLA